MDVRNWEFLANALENLGAIEKDLLSSGFATKIAYTAFFWSLITYQDSDDPESYKTGAMSMPDYLTDANRQRIEAISQQLDAWLKEQPADVHPLADRLRAALEVGLNATSAPILDPRSKRG